MRIFEDQNISVEPDDIFCFWTGLDQLILNANGNPAPSIKQSRAVLNGRHEKLLQWIEDSGLAAIASDTIAVEARGKPASRKP